MNKQTKQHYLVPTAEAVEITPSAAVLQTSDMALIISGNIPEATIPALEISDINITY